MEWAENQRLIDEIDRNGFSVFDSGITPDKIARVRELISAHAPIRASRRQAMFGARSLLEIEEISALAHSGPLREIVESVVGPDALAVRAIYFDKTADANWPVPWHQDLTVAVYVARRTRRAGPRGQSKRAFNMPRRRKIF